MGEVLRGGEALGAGEDGEPVAVGEGLEEEKDTLPQMMDLRLGSLRHVLVDPCPETIHEAIKQGVASGEVDVGVLEAFLQHGVHLADGLVVGLDDAGLLEV